LARHDRFIDRFARFLLDLLAFCSIRLDVADLDFKSRIGCLPYL
jgi:hypothetical protein